MRKQILHNLYASERERNIKSAEKEVVKKKERHKQEGSEFFHKKVKVVERKVKRRERIMQRLREPVVKKNKAEQAFKKREYLQVAAKKLAATEKRQKSRARRETRVKKKKLARAKARRVKKRAERKVK